MLCIQFIEVGFVCLPRLGLRAIRGAGGSSTEQHANLPLGKRRGSSESTWNKEIPGEDAAGRVNQCEEGSTQGRVGEVNFCLEYQHHL